MIIFRLFTLSASLIKLILFTQRDMTELPLDLTSENNYTIVISTDIGKIRSMKIWPHFLANTSYWKTFQNQNSLTIQLLFHDFLLDQLTSPQLNKEVLQFILEVSDISTNSFILSQLDAQDRIDLIVQILHFAEGKNDLFLFKDTIYFLIKNSISKNSTIIDINDSSNSTKPFVAYKLLFKIICTSTTNISEIMELFDLLTTSDELFTFLSKLVNDFNIYNHPKLIKLYNDTVKLRQN